MRRRGPGRRRADASLDRLVERAVPEFSQLFDEDLLTHYERDSIRKRLQNMRRYARQVMEAAHTLDLPQDLPPPAHHDAPRREGAFRSVLGEIVEDSRPELKRSVAGRIVDKMGRHYLWTNLSSLPVFHEATALGPWWMVNNVPSRHFRRFADYLSGELLTGIVISLQRVREEILSSREVYLAHCVCRSSGIAHDLTQGGEVFTLLGEAENRLLLDRLVDRYQAIGPDRARQTTAARYRRIFERLGALRNSGSPEYRMESFLQWTYPDWELIPVHPRYTARWARSMRNNRKAFPIDKGLALELVDTFFLTRGAVFNSMKAVDSPYCICCCPTPENEGGCVLTNWYYYGKMNRSLIPADDHHGRRRDEHGQVRPCRYFPIKARRDCIGCGCDHGQEAPRALATVLGESDRLVEGWRR